MALFLVGLKNFSNNIGQTVSSNWPELYYEHCSSRTKVVFAGDHRLVFEPMLLEIPKLFLTGPSFERLFTIRLLPRLFTEVNSHILQLIG